MRCYTILYNTIQYNTIQYKCIYAKDHTRKKKLPVPKPSYSRETTLFTAIQICNNSYASYMYDNLTLNLSCNVRTHLCQMDFPTINLWTRPFLILGVYVVFFLLSLPCFIEIQNNANSADPDQTPRSEYEPSNPCALRRFRSAYACAQSDQNLHWCILDS